MSERVLLKACGTCALLGAAALIGGSLVSVLFGLGGENLPCRDGKQLLLLFEKRTPYLTRESLFLLYPIFALAEGYGLYLFLRRAGAFVGAALAAWLCGLVIGIVTDILSLTLVVQLAPEYAAAGEASRPALEALARVLDSYIGLMQLVCEALVSAVGLSLFAVAVFRTGAAPRWLAWVGLAAAMLVGLVYRPLNTLSGDSPPVALAGSLGFMLSAVWDVGMGLLLLQPPESGVQVRESP